MREILNNAFYSIYAKTADSHIDTGIQINKNTL